jgi:hypothetical protein
MMVRNTILILFITGVALSIIIVFFSFYKNEIGPESLGDLVTKLLSIYSAPLGIILGGIFAKQGVVPLLAAQTAQGTPPTTERTSGGLIFAAITAVLLWNGLLLGRLVIFWLREEDSVTALISYLGTIQLYSTFFFSAVLAYFFAKS